MPSSGQRISQAFPARWVAGVWRWWGTAHFLQAPTPAVALPAECSHSPARPRPAGYTRAWHRAAMGIGLSAVAVLSSAISPMIASAKTAPAVTITDGPTGTVRTPSASFSFTSSTNNATFTCKLDSSGWTGCTSPRKYSDVANGSHTFQVQAKGPGGVTGQPAGSSWTVNSMYGLAAGGIIQSENATTLSRDLDQYNAVGAG